jgi:sugar/nucleoside kinase (ribokinase family)
VRPVSTLGVIGNISRDLALYPDGRRFEQLGGAALHVARAANRAGLSSAPISVIGADLSWIRHDVRLADLDLSHVKVMPGASCAFRITYAIDDRLWDIDCAFGVAEALTGHCLAVIGQHDRYHVCCRRPLDVAAVLSSLADAELPFSADFHLASASQLISAAAPLLPHAQVVFVNAAEFTALASKMDPRRLAAVVVSDGPREVTLLQSGQACAAVRPQRTGVVEVTGAGDALAGAFLAAAAHGLTGEDALHTAVAAATESTRHPGFAIPHQQDMS